MAEVGDLFLGRYTLHEVRTAPAFVRSFIATDHNLNRRVEVTLLQPRFAGHDEFARQFLAEARKVMDLDHPSIARIYDVGSNRAQGLFYVIAEHVEGTQLTRYVRRTQPSVTHIMTLLESVFGGLAQAHTAGVAHLGLTPTTILVTDAQRPRLIDLGLLGFAANLAGSADALAATLGTSGYLAPEQILSAHGVDASDVYAGGLLLSEALTGRPTWDGNVRGDDLIRRAQTAAALPASARPELDPELNALVERCLRRAPEDRPTASEVASALASLSAIALGSTVAVDVEPELAETELLSTVVPVVSPARSIPAGVAPDLAKIFPPSALSTREFSANEFTAGRTRSALVSTVIIAVASVVAFSAIILFVVSTLPANFLPSTSRTVPSVVGLSYDEALTAINSAGLTVSRKDEPSATVAADMVTSTSPVAGSKVEVGSQVVIAVSTGSAKVTVPNVVGMTLATATDALRKAGLSLGSTTKVPSALATKGGVVATIPAIGSQVSAGTTINLSLANGLVRIPSLVGKSITDASAMLLSPAIAITPIIKSSASCPATNPISVFTQSPSAGDVPTNTKVTLTYCSGN